MSTSIVSAVEICCDQIIPSSCYIRQPVELADGDELTIAPVKNELRIRSFGIVSHSKLNTFPHRIFQTLPHVEVVTLEISNIRAMSPESFHGASHLQNLRLSGNNLTTLPKDVFKNALKLLELILSDNQIAEIENGAFSGLTQLQTLKLNGNRLKALRTGIFADLVNLEFLHLHWNQLETIGIGVLTLPMLNEVFFAHNQLTTLPADLFDGAPNVQYTEFSDNQLQRIDNTFAKCDKLIYLNLENNRIEDLDLAKFASMKSLQVLSLDNTNFNLPSTPVSTEQSSPVISLNLANNELTDSNLFEHLAIFPNLERLYLYNTVFSSFDEPHRIKRLLPKLNMLDLVGNKLISGWLQRNKNVFKSNGIVVVSDTF